MSDQRRRVIFSCEPTTRPGYCRHDRGGRPPTQSFRGLREPRASAQVGLGEVQPRLSLRRRGHSTIRLKPVRLSVQNPLGSLRRIPWWVVLRDPVYLGAIVVILAIHVAIFFLVAGW